ncbi:MAG: CBS domain-containing protein [Nanoarchaeota archaeon]|nr:CBS domain-containing protein [Nanoarchaeota archaeon]
MKLETIKGMSLKSLSLSDVPSITKNSTLLDYLRLVGEKRCYFCIVEGSTDSVKVIQYEQVLDYLTRKKKINLGEIKVKEIMGDIKNYPFARETDTISSVRKRFLEHRFLQSLLIFDEEDKVIGTLGRKDLAYQIMKLSGI